MFKIRFSGNTKFQLKFNGNTIGSSYPIYDGETTIIPDFEAQTLSTKNKLMKDDLIVDQIPHYTVSNNKGDTFIIGKGDLEV